MDGLEVTRTPGTPRAGADTIARLWLPWGMIAAACSAAALLGVSALHGGAIHGDLGRMLGGSGAGNQTLPSPGSSVPPLERLPLAARDNATSALALALRGNVRARRGAGNSRVKVTFVGLNCIAESTSYQLETPDPYILCEWENDNGGWQSQKLTDTFTPKWNAGPDVYLSQDQKNNGQLQDLGRGRRMEPGRLSGPVPDTSGRWPRVCGGACADEREVPSENGFRER